MRIIRLTLVWALSLTALLLFNHTLSAQSPSAGAEVRLAARDFGNGAVSVGLQYRHDGAWRSVTPTRHILPASAGFEHWYTTSATEIEVVQASVEIGLRNRAWTAVDGPDQFTVAFGDSRYRARCGRLILSLKESGLEMQTGSRDCEEIVTVEPPELADPTDVGAQVLRVAARRLSTGGIELGAQRLVGGQWEALRQPDRSVLTALSRSAWRYTSALQLPVLPGHVFGVLRRGAAISTRDGEFELAVDGRVYRTRCGVLDLRIVTEHILVDTATEECHGSDPLLTICPTSDCDVQQNAAYAWESRHVGASLDQIEVTRSEAQAVVNAIWSDYYRFAAPPTVTFTYDQAHGHADRNEIVLGTRVQTLGPVVHELAHSIIDRSNIRDAGHGGQFTAMLLELWDRYFQIADVQAARDDAERHGIEVASRPPIQTRFSEARQVIGELFCDGWQGPTRQQMCNSASGAMSEHADHEAAGLYTGWGGDDYMWWAAHVDEESDELRSYVAMDSVIGQTRSTARLSVQCEGDQLEVNVYWDVAQDLDWTILYRLSDGDVQTEEWISGWGTWGDTEYKWTGREEAADLVAALAWAAQTHGTFTVQSHARDDTNSYYTASFDLDGLFDTPVQPNLARCGR